MQSLQQHLNKIAALFYQLGGEKAVICPGSRNAPLIVAFARHPKLKCVPVSDERSAAFIALGIAQQTRKPVAIICTSGTATLNFYPAICEAFYQNIPLIAITADRPPELIDQWDGQAIRQKDLFKNHILSAVHFPYPLQEDSMQRIEKEIGATMQLSAAQKLPVHINVPLNEPFYPSENEIYNYDESNFISIESQLLPEHRSEHDVFDIQNILQQIQDKANVDGNLKLLVVLGYNDYPEKVMKCIQKAQASFDFPMIADIISHYPFENTIRNYDFLLDSKADSVFQPDVLITLGNAVVSKSLRKYLRSYPPQKHFHIQEFGYVGDPYQSLTHAVRFNPETFFNAFAALDISASIYHRLFQTEDKKIDINARLSGIPFCEAKAASIILKSLPHNSHLQLANSMSVRYAMLFGVNSSIVIHSNRGTSGIDGCTSTAVGAAITTQKITTLITGDIAFFYDVNAFWNSLNFSNLRIILLNNGGGGIFRLIDGPSKLKELDEFLENSHARTALNIATDFNFQYTHVAHEAALESALQNFYEASHRPKILEIFTDKFVNETEYKKLKKLTMDN